MAFTTGFEKVAGIGDQLKKFKSFLGGYSTKGLRAETNLAAKRLAEDKAILAANPKGGYTAIEPERTNTRFQPSNNPIVGWHWNKNG